MEGKERRRSREEVNMVGDGKIDKEEGTII